MKMLISLTIWVQWSLCAPPYLIGEDCTSLHSLFVYEETIKVSDCMTIFLTNMELEISDLSF